ncbi:MAG: DegT/DnrJ/EryC1/StrS family aminotransferase, partial [Armatimonadota bacterium]|nr:DegT/DnrJ/EryC1/StrS family aminotransferase [Armatimonadota bacterium]
MSAGTSRLAILGGPKAVQTPVGDIFRWPIITEEDEQAVLEVLRAGNMSGTNVTMAFEEEFAAWHGVKYALGHNTGTAALQAAMWACGVGVGDEIIAPSLTYWASALPAFGLGATVVFADVHPDTITIDPADIERHISERTKAIVPVHYAGYPADMDPIMAIAEKYNLKVIEDVSHAHGGLYKGRLLGTIGHIGAMSVMSGKSFAVGEGGMLITNDRHLWERAVAFGHYERTSTAVRWGTGEKVLTDPELLKFAGLPQGGVKFRMHQLSSAVGRVQLRHYKERMEEIQKAMNYFWDLLEGVPGVKAHRPPKESGSTMGGWYAAHGLYRAEELEGLPIQKFCEAVRAEGV